ncbi:oxygen-independent coproporphyrinogen III oxidase [Desulfocucumis palustris]|uniref:Oxygen-independent coproporphyrinogen III oxidase n=1 Tax=Desulfocucumis palustris TaxID=1898651 RepID=A0A2L2XLX5_9FIRM|nr:radical SAM protein [Desulfocucumis palustris]GBF34951.1 oxygen-independent coproporphyrinogen III oxidase [Desulfocucumis palustris]
MRYEEPLFRPPSEAFSLILQVTIGCSHNACTFCGMYKGKKFRIREWREIEEDIADASKYAGDVRRIFLADGNVLAMPAEQLIRLLKRLESAFPRLQRVTAYAGPKDILRKSPGELLEIRKAGLKILYLGVESGNENILKEINKGVTVAEMEEAGRKALEAGFKLSVTVITGLGGREKSREHAVDTAKLLSRMDPTYIGALTLMPVPKTPIYDKIKQGGLSLLNPLESLQEIKWMLENMNLTGCVFRCNHASNYLPLKGTLNKDRERLTELLDDVLSRPGKYNLKPEYMRGL